MILARKISIVLITISFFLVCCGCGHTVDTQEEKSIVGTVSNESTAANTSAQTSDNQDKKKDDNITEDLKGDINTYTDERFKFKVDFPAKWKYMILGSWGYTLDKKVTYDEALKDGKGRLDPDGGIVLYIDGNKGEMVSISGEDGHSAPVEPNSISEEFITKSGLKGNIHSTVIDNKINIYCNITDDSLYSYVIAHIMVSKDCFEQNKKDIYRIFRSIRASN